MEQLEAVLARAPGDVSMVYCDLREPGWTARAVERARAAGVPVGLATLRTLKPGEEDSLRELAEAGPDAILVRNLAALAFFVSVGEDTPKHSLGVAPFAFGREHRVPRPNSFGRARSEPSPNANYLAVRTPRPVLVGDFSLNAANDLAANLLFSLGLDRLTPGLDADGERLEAMLRHADPGRFEVIVHQHVPMFHTQHCLFAARLSRGRDRGDCGRACRRRVELLDRMGEAHPVLPDAACRNTVYRSRARSAAGDLGRLRRLGVRHFRIELLRETPEEVRALLGKWTRLTGV
jgi:putative protease